MCSVASCFLNQLRKFLYLIAQAKLQRTLHIPPDLLIFNPRTLLPATAYTRRPQQGPRLAAGHPQGLALTPARTAPLPKPEAGIKPPPSRVSNVIVLADLQLPAYSNQMPVHLLSRRLGITAAKHRQQLPVRLNSGPRRFRTAAIAVVDG